MVQIVDRPDAVIVGGGIGGLATATFLARGGNRVRLIEQSHSLGGRARTAQRDGFFFNVGPHALYRSVGLEVLKDLGVHAVGGRPPIAGAFALKEGRKHTFPAGFLSLLTTGLFDLSAKLETARLLRSVGKLDPEPLMGISLKQWADSSISHVAVRQLLLATFRLATYTNAPEVMSAGAAVGQLQKALARGVLYLDGGWQTLVDGLAESAARAGVQVETGVKIENVELATDGTVRGVRLAGGHHLEAKSVVIASSPSVAAALVDSGKATALASCLAQAVPVKAACLDVALHNLPVAAATFALGIDQPIYLSVHSAAARLAPRGGAMIHVAKYLSPDQDQSSDAIECELEAVLDLVQPGWRESLVFKRFLPDMVVMNAMPTAAQGGTHGRPGPAVPDVPGLYVVGDWVGKQGLLADASLASAREAAEMIAARLSRSMVVRGSHASWQTWTRIRSGAQSSRSIDY